MESSYVTTGLLKVVAATETLAAGINMPARTTVIGSLSHRQNAGHVLLKHNQLLQMAGRAGRRGFDTAGTTTTAELLALQDPACVSSSFLPCGTVVTHLASRGSSNTALFNMPRNRAFPLLTAVAEFCRGA
jgi:superfamily II RNA helicase